MQGSHDHLGAKEQREDGSGVTGRRFDCAKEIRRGIPIPRVLPEEIRLVPVALEIDPRFRVLARDPSRDPERKWRAERHGSRPRLVAPSARFAAAAGSPLSMHRQVSICLAGECRTNPNVPHIAIRRPPRTVQARSSSLQRPELN